MFIKNTAIYFIILTSGCSLYMHADSTKINCLFSHGIADSGLQVLEYLPKSDEYNQQHVNILFSHGLGDTNKIARVYQNGSSKDPHSLSTIPFPVYSFDYEDARSGMLYKIPRIENTSLAQTNEILRFKEAFLITSDLLLKQQGPNYKLVLYGLSRGASTIIMFLALYPELCDRVAAVILESPFDSIDTVIQNKINSMKLQNVVSLTTGHRIFKSIFKLYNASFPSPITVIHTIPTSIPILFICTNEDATIPSFSTKKLYGSLLLHGHKDVHLIAVDHGKHGKILQGPDGKIYKDGVDQFYKRYGLV